MTVRIDIAIIVDRNAAAEIGELAKHSDDRFRFLHHDVFGNFQIETFRIETSGIQRLQNQGRHVDAAKLYR